MEGLPGARVDNPAHRHAHGKIFPIFSPISDSVSPRGEDLNAKQCRSADNLFSGSFYRDHHHIGDAKAVGPDLQPHFGHYTAPELAPLPQPASDVQLQKAVTLLAQIPLYQLAVDVIAVGVVGCPKIFFDRNECSHTHNDILSADFVTGAGMTSERWRKIEQLYHAALEGGRGVLACVDPEL